MRCGRRIAGNCRVDLVNGHHRGSDFRNRCVSRRRDSAGTDDLGQAPHQFTDLLPLLEELDAAPTAVGKSTVEAMRLRFVLGRRRRNSRACVALLEDMDITPVAFVAGGSSHVVAHLLGRRSASRTAIDARRIALSARAKHERRV